MNDILDIGKTKTLNKKADCFTKGKIFDFIKRDIIVM